MTIKIIEDGKKDWLRKYTATCKRCRCKFECSRIDGEYQAQDYRGEGDFVRLFCPNCKHECFAY